MRRNLSVVLFACALFSGQHLPVSRAVADPSLPHVFGHNMVLQRGKPIPVWGKADPGETVRVAIGDATQEAVAGADGKWRVDLPAMAAAGPFEVRVTGKSSVTFTNVLVGEVWLCSGQSNMAMTMGGTAYAPDRLAKADLPHVRLLTVPRKASPLPLDDADVLWRVCTPETAIGFSAVAYFFGREIHVRTNVPIGLINTSWGGTRIEPWSTYESLRAVPSMAETLPEFAPEVIAERQQEYEAKAAEREARSDELVAMEADDALLKAMSDPALDDTGWETMAVPMRWEKAGLKNFDGLVWYRKAVEVPEAWAGRELVLDLCPVDEADATCFNGVRVGGKGAFRPLDTVYWDKPRRYTVPGELVRAGRNVITVRVIDSAFAGGLWGGSADQVRLTRVGADGEEPIALAGDWKVKVGLQLPEDKAPMSHQSPTALYNAMVHPFVPYGIRGAIWYQGESNGGEGYGYRPKLEALIRGWREVWGGEAFPFYYVQIAPYSYGGQQGEAPICALRQAQLDTLAVENTGMAVIMDIGNVRDIHPRNKEDVGKRLALWALKNDYGFSDLVHSGPLYKSMTVAEDGSVRVEFDHVGSGLVSRGDRALAWFDVAGEDGVFKRAVGRIDGNAVIVRGYGTNAPAAVRYGWSDVAEPNLMNLEGLPASPFTSEKLGEPAP